LLRTILGAVGLGGAATIGAYWLLGRAVVIDYAEGLTGAQRLTAAFATATAIGAIVALVVNVRKQDLAERTAAQAEAQYAETLFRDREAAFTDRFRAASQQLGAAAPPERIAGVYAMAALGDDYLDRRQQCVDVLCGYLRLPWDPDLDDLAVTSTTVTETSPEGATTAQTTTPARRPHDAQVRATIVAVIAAHTRHPNTRTSWTDLNFNLRGAYFRNIALVECCFSGSVTFDGARFSGKDTWFAGATFSGSVTFDGARFSGSVTYEGARFSGSDTSFDGATFSGENTSFAGAAFSGQLTWFDRATFSGENTWFDRATFSAKDTRFDRARFSGSDTSFDGARFSGENTSFAGATFSGENTWFDRATFSGEYASFDGAGFCGFDASFEDAAFSGTAISFKDTLVSEGILRLTDVVDPRTMLAGLLIEDGAKVLVDGKRYTPPDPPQTQEEGSS
jgi:uncharacterized protein YjbI with pentapeptide repeats